MKMIITVMEYLEGTRGRLQRELTQCPHGEGGVISSPGSASICTPTSKAQKSLDSDTRCIQPSSGLSCSKELSEVVGSSCPPARSMQEAQPLPPSVFLIYAQWGSCAIIVYLCGYHWHFCDPWHASEHNHIILRGRSAEPSLLGPLPPSFKA